MLKLNNRILFFIVDQLLLKLTLATRLEVNTKTSIPPHVLADYFDFYYIIDLMFIIVYILNFIVKLSLAAARF